MLNCKKCEHNKFTIEEQEFKNGTKHLRANCAACGAYLCYLPQSSNAEIGPGDFEMHFGKHKGKKIKELPSDYIKWLAKECKQKKVKQFANAYLHGI